MIYFDHAATTATDPKVLKSIINTIRKYPANPSSSHSLGRQAKKVIENSRNRLAEALNCSPEEIVFTASGSEANNLALKGLISGLINQRKSRIKILTSQFEHKSVLESVKDLESFNGAEVEVKYLKPDKDCQITAEAVRQAISKEVRLISIMMVNNELGTIQPIREIGKLIERENQNRTKNNKIYFHTDAVQAFEYLDCNVKELLIDLLSLSAHKFYGPKGIGALFIRKETPIKPLISGGGQELGLRAGTENIPLIAGMAKAVQLAINDRSENNRKVTKLREYFENQLKKQLAKTTINCQRTERAPHIASVVFKDAEGESIMLALDLVGVAVSTGSACAAKDLTVSHVLSSINLSPEQGQSTIRFSFGKENRKKEVDQTIKELIKIVSRLRKISPKN